jgi:3-hydroxybutyryl-CoA dehydratase
MYFKKANLETLEIGMSGEYSQTITDADIKAYAGLSGDNNPVHMDDVYAQNSRFKRRIAHGLFSSGFFSAIFGTKIPGPGCVYASQNLEFKRPVYMGDTVKAYVEITKIDLVSRKVTFSTKCTVKNKCVIDGEAVLYIPKEVEQC